MESGHVTTVFMNFHLEALELIQFFSNGSLVLGSQSSPGLVCSSIVVVCCSDFNVIIETDDLTGLQLLDGGSETQLSIEDGFLLFPLPHHLFWGLSFEDVPLLQFLRGGPQAESSVQADADFFSDPHPLLVCHRGEDVLLYQFLHIGPLGEFQRETVFPSNFSISSTPLIVAIVVAPFDGIL